MIHKLTKNEYKVFLLKSEEQIAEIFKILDEKENIDVLASLIFNPSSFSQLKSEFPDIDPKRLSELITKAKKLGIIEFTEDEKYKATEAGKNFFHGIVHIIIDTHINHRIPDDIMKKIIYDYIGKEEVEKRRKQKEIEHAKEVELGLFPV